MVEVLIQWKLANTRYYGFRDLVTKQTFTSKSLLIAECLSYRISKGKHDQARRRINIILQKEIKDLQTLVRINMFSL